MQHTIQHQLTQALEQSRTEGQLQYAAWIRQGEAKGLRGLFRNLKASELAWQRPYRNVPMADRMRHRLHDWHQLWRTTSPWSGTPHRPAPNNKQLNYRHSR